MKSFGLLLAIVHLAVGGCVVAFQPPNYTSSNVPTLNVTDLAGVVTLPLLVVLDSRGTVW